MVMTQLAYMTREDWAQHGTAMVQQSTVIRDWIGEAPYLFAVTDVRKFRQDGRDADVEAASFIAPDRSTRRVLNISELSGLRGRNQVLDHAIVVLHPHNETDLEALATAVNDQSIEKAFVLIWSPRDMVRTWLDGKDALDLHTGKLADSPNPLLIEAARSMVDEEYNGLSSGRGKEVVVQLIRAFAAEGHPMDSNVWLRAYFAAGGTFRHASSISKLISEMNKGVKHRVRPALVGNIVQVLRDRVAEA